MKAQVLAILTVLSTLPAMAQAASLIPEGQYEGRGLGKTEAGQGSYQVKTSIVDNVLSSTYTLSNGDVKSVQITLVPTKNGFLTAQISGQNVGTGYCLDHATLCHFEINAGGVALEETMTVENSMLFVFGSKVQYGVKVFWQEALSKK